MCIMKWILDQDRNVVVEVIDDRTKEQLGDWLKARPEGHLNAVESVSMDMWNPFIQALLEWTFALFERMRNEILGHSPLSFFTPICTLVR